MRIGIDARMYSSSFTGIGRYVYELTRHLFQIDRNNEYILFFNSPEYQKFRPPGPRVHKRLVDARHYSWDEQFKFRHILNQENLDLMHFTHFNAPILFQRPAIVTIHDLTLSFFPGKKMTSWAHRLGYKLVLGQTVKKAQALIAVSAHTKNDLQKIPGTDLAKISVIYEAAGQEFKKIHNPERLEATKQKLRIDKPFILYTGVWRSHKNVVGLIKAFDLLIKAGRFDGYLVITGREDPFYPEVKKTVYDLRLEKLVRFTGLVGEDDLICLYNSAVLFVLPSFYEGFGLSPLEAFACGTPVAASNAACLPEICGKRNALFFDPYSPEDIADKMWLILSNNQLRNELIQRGFIRIKKFSWEKTAAETLALYEKVLTMNKRP